MSIPTKLCPVCRASQPATTPVCLRAGCGYVFSSNVTVMEPGPQARTVAMPPRHSPTARNAWIVVALLAVALAIGTELYRTYQTREAAAPTVISPTPGGPTHIPAPVGNTLPPIPNMPAGWPNVPQAQVRSGDDAAAASSAAVLGYLNWIQSAEKLHHQSASYRLCQKYRLWRSGGEIPDLHDGIVGANNMNDLATVQSDFRIFEFRTQPKVPNECATLSARYSKALSLESGLARVANSALYDSAVPTAGEALLRDRDRAFQDAQAELDNITRIYGITIRWRLAPDPAF